MRKLIILYNFTGGQSGQYKTTPINFIIMEMMDVFPGLETPRLNLIEIEQKHLNDLFLLFGNARVTRYYNIKTFKKVEDGQIYLDWFRSRFKEKAGIRWGIQPKNKESIIGTIGFNNFTPHHRSNIGYDLQPAYWRQGFMTEALKAVIRFGFDRLEVNRIEAEVMSGNINSELLLYKLGFQKEGVLREWMYWNNKYFDMSMFALIKEKQYHK